MSMTTQQALDRIDEARRAADPARVEAREASARLERAILEAITVGATQSQVAARAGVSQPYISKVLRRRDRFRPTSRLGVVLAANRDTVKKVLHAHGAPNVAVFGSVAAGTDDPDSDIDLIADLPADLGLFGLAKIEAELAGILGVRVDLVPRRLLTSSIRETAERTMVLLRAAPTANTSRTRRPISPLLQD
jgi:predicted nucleotidyltransferase